MTAAEAKQPAKQAPRRAKVMGSLGDVFKLDREEFNLARGLVIFAMLIVPLIVLSVIDLKQYWLSVSFGAIFVGLSDPGGEMRPRSAMVASVALIGTFLTVLGSGSARRLGGGSWWRRSRSRSWPDWQIRFGTNRFVAGVLLNTWFVLALGLAASNHRIGVATPAWKQALAWLIGSAVWAVVLGIVWLANGRKPPSRPVPEIPGDLSPRPLTPPLVAFSLLRALAMAVAVAIAWGFDLPNAYWMPLAALISMKPTLEQTRLVAAERLVGALIGAVLAAVFLLSIDNKHALEVLIGALVALDLPNPANLSAEGERVLYTLVGVGIGSL